MKNIAVWCLLGMLSLVCAAGTQAQNAGAAAEQAVAALEDLWLQAQRTNNPDLIAPHWDEKIVSTSSDGKVEGKAGMLAISKSTKYANVDYTDMKFTAFGDTVISTGVYKGTSTDASGKTVSQVERWTDTWVKMPDGAWKCVATQTSPVTK